MKNINEYDIWIDWPNSKKSDLIHDFTMRNYDRANKIIDYGIGENCTPVEAHLLEKIYENPDITITQLAERVNRSKSAISQIVTKLESKGYVRKKPHKNHGRRISLQVTTKGKKLTLRHIEYDEKAAGVFFDKLSQNFDDTTMAAFFRVMQQFIINMYASEGYED